jgi:hypothetical protein
VTEASKILFFSQTREPDENVYHRGHHDQTKQDRQDVLFFRTREGKKQKHHKQYDD